MQRTSGVVSCSTLHYVIQVLQERFTAPYATASFNRPLTNLKLKIQWERLKEGLKLSSNKKHMFKRVKTLWCRMV